MKLLVTGGSGFIVSAVIRHIIANSEDSIVNVVKLTYASELKSFSDVEGSARYAFEQMNTCNQSGLERVFHENRPNAVMHPAAEDHVDRSNGLEVQCKAAFRFHHISTDEVYGDLGEPESSTTPLEPRPLYLLDRRPPRPRPALCSL